METLTSNTGNQITEQLQVQPLTEAEIRSENREYNERVWDETITRYAKYKGAKFYVARKQRGYDYDRYFVKYEIEDGIIFFKSVSYSSCISNNGFCRIIIEADKFVYRSFLPCTNGKFGRVENNKESRLIMARNSQNAGVIYSNEF